MSCFPCQFSFLNLPEKNGKSVACLKSHEVGVTLNNGSHVKFH